MTNINNSTAVNAIIPWTTTYRNLIISAGEKAPKLRYALICLLFAAVFQGASFALIYPIFLSAFDSQITNLLLNLTIATSFMLIATTLRWIGQSFDYNGDMLHTTHALRTKLGKQLRSMPLLKLQNKRTGEINATLIGNVDENLMYSLTIISAIFDALIIPITAGLVVLFIDFRMGLLILLIFPLLVPFYRWRKPAFDRGMRYLAEASSKTSADIVEYTQGLPVLRNARSEGLKAKDLQASFANLERIQTIGHQKGSRPNLIITTCMELGLLLLAFIGIYLATSGQIHHSLAAASLVLVIRFTEPLANFISYAAIMSLIETALERVNNLLNINPLPQIIPTQIPNNFNIKFEQVTFTYPSAQNPAISDFELEIKQNSMTALVGASGSGKSTLIRMLLRHFDPQNGKITIGNVDIRQIATSELNNMIAVVFQDVYLFDDTILANIQMARPDASFAEVQKAAKIAQCLDFIENLPDGWNTKLGDNGAKLSGGERQRISIARAFLKDAPIIILDEPTAALDTLSEVAVQNAIDILVKNKTVIVIAHRLSTISGADKIAVLDNGKLVESGTHKELLGNLNGKYQFLWQCQQKTKNWHIN